MYWLILRGGLSVWYDANRPEHPSQRKVKATAHKCDLCAGRENGPACVENCPADALQLVTDAALSGMAKSRRLRTARQEHQPWHASTAAQEMPVMSKVEQMQATPARGEPDKLAIEARKTGFDGIYYPCRSGTTGSLALP